MMKKGNQIPTFEHVGDYAYSMGAEVADMFEAEGGATFYPSQRHELELMLARNEDGSPAGMTIAISKPRQNGKSYAARFYAVYMALFEHRDVLYSAQHSATTKKMFMALCDLFESPERFPEFARSIKSISHSRGYEGFYFRDWTDKEDNVHRGGSIEFVTRTTGGQRGGTYSVIIYDEAQLLSLEEQAGILPTISAASSVEDKKSMPQQIFIGTPPTIGTGEVFRQMHSVAHSGGSGIWWIEWSFQSDNILADITSREKVLELAYKTNPAMGYRIDEKTVLNEFETMPLDSFCRERLNWFSPTVADRTVKAINRESWQGCRSDEPKQEGKTGFGVKFSADGSFCVLAGACIQNDGKTRVEIIRAEPLGIGLAWLADWLNERYRKASCVVIDGKGSADVLIDRIREVWKLRESVKKTGTNDVIAAASLFVNEINENTLTWYGYQEELSEAALSVTKRKIGTGWGFGGSGAELIEACALALWGVKTSKRNPQKQMLIG